MSTKQLILRMVKIIRRIIYVYDSNLLAATVCKKPASPQGIAALAVQESVDTLTKRSDEHSQSGCFSLPTENEARRMHDTQIGEYRSASLHSQRGLGSSANLSLFGRLVIAIP